MSGITERILSIRQQLPATVRLIAVTKQVAIPAMREAYAAGIRDFGESRVQEVETKLAQLQDLPGLTWHLIGHLQSNKVQKAIDLFEWIHSVDSFKLAQRLDQLAAPLQKQPKICLQVKLQPDPNKYGWSIAELLADLQKLKDCGNLKICGLMAIPPLGLDPVEVRSLFQQARELAETLQPQFSSPLQLSMGMSGDYTIAVEEGATMVRLGSILFGDRSDRPQEYLTQDSRVFKG
ncbi:MAG TPA: YggS family pyridoxal phosphate-dependent enzyme [Thermosynechococcaceae cyanobacterium]